MTEFAGAAAPSPLTPPDQVATLTLTAPAPPQRGRRDPGAGDGAAGRRRAGPGLDAKVDSYLDALMKAQTRSPEFAAKATDVRTMGDSDIRQAAETSNRLLKSPVKALQEGGLSEGSKVGATLLELRRTVEDLDPKEATGAKKLLGMIPFGDRVTDYFRKYQSAEKHLDGILHGLREGQDELGKDNAALNLEKQLLWAPWRGSTSTSTSPSGSTPGSPSRSPTSRPPTRSGPGRCATTSCSTSGRSTRTC